MKQKPINNNIICCHLFNSVIPDKYQRTLFNSPSGAAFGTFRESWRISCSYWYLFPSKGAWKACFSILLAQGEIPASGSMHPSRWLSDPPREKTKSNRGDPALHLHQARGHLSWRMGLSALLGGNLGCWIVKFPPKLHSLWVCHKQNTLWP